MQALIAGEVQVAFVDAVTALPLMASGQILALGVSTLERNPLAPEVRPSRNPASPASRRRATSPCPPAGTPPAIVQRLAVAKAAALANPEVLEKLKQNSIFPTSGTPEEFPAYLGPKARNGAS